MKLAVILPAAGQSRRFNQGSKGPKKSKLELTLAGKTVLMRSVELFTNCSQVTQIIIAVDPSQLDTFKFKWADKLAFYQVKIVAGGQVERWQTVQKALSHVASDCTHVAIHDAARPIASRALIKRIIQAATIYDAVIPAVAISSTLKRAKPVNALATAKKSAENPLDTLLKSSDTSPTIEAHKVVATVDRSQLWAVQTPQIFKRDLLDAAYVQMRTATVDAKTITDDACLVEALGQSVYIVQGESTNLKLTVQADIELAAIIAEKQDAASGHYLAKKRLFADLDDE